MYKIIIVEDEYEIRQSISESIKWQKIGYELVGQAGNGREALDMIEKYEVDVVITDIKMPFLDGIELAKAIREFNPIVKIIFISGYNEFDYAMSAIKFNVIDYLLKPVTKKKLLECLKNTKEKLDDDKKKMEAQTKKSYEDNFPALRIMFLYSLITRDLKDEFITKKVEYYQLNLIGETNLLFTISVDKNSIYANMINFAADPELVITSIVGLVKNIVGKYVKYEFFIYDENVVVILSDTVPNINMYADMLIVELHKSIKRYFGFSVTIGISGIFEKLSKAPKAYADSISAIHYRLIIGSDKIIYSTDFETTMSQSYVLNDATEIHFNSIIKVGNEKELKAFLSDFFKNLQENGTSLPAYQISIINLYSILIKVLTNIVDNFDIDVGNGLSFISNLYKHETVEDIQAWFEGFCIKAMEYISLQRQSTTDVIGCKAMAYIKENYADPDISLKKVSNSMHLSPNYLSAVFKKSTGQPFTEFLVNIRMEKAKELLCSTGLKIFEIAEKTGYTDQHYFSYCFKKYYGSSPLEMRNTINEKKIKV